MTIQVVTAKKIGAKMVTTLTVQFVAWRTGTIKPHMRRKFLPRSPSSDGTRTVSNLLIEYHRHKNRNLYNKKVNKVYHQLR